MERCTKFLICVFIIGLAIFLIGVIFGFTILPDHIKDKIIHAVRLYLDSEQFHKWQNNSHSYYHDIYFFNITNSEDVLNYGAKPIVQEVGPYVFHGEIKREEVDYSNRTGYIRYKQKNVYRFSRSQTPRHLSITDTVTSINVPLVILIQFLEGNSYLPDVFNLGQVEAFPGSSEASPFQDISVQDYSFKGYNFCDPSHLEGIFSNLICFLVHTNIQPINISQTRAKGEGIKFSFCGKMNNTYDGTWEMDSGIHDISKLGQLETWNGQPTQNFWIHDNNKCNLVRGTAPTIFKPFNEMYSTFDSYLSKLCRPVLFDTCDTITFKGIEGYRSILRGDTLLNTNENSCYCINKTKSLDGDFECMPDGFLDMQSCYGIPFILSFPHFLWSDPSYADTISGLNPKCEKHESFIDMEPTTGTILRQSFRFQLNMILRKFDGINVTKKIKKGMVIPLIWIDEHYEISDESAQRLKDKYLNYIEMLIVIRWIMVGVGFLLMLVCVGYFLVSKRNITIKG